MVSRIYVEKRPGFDVAAQGLAGELHDIVGIASLTGVRLINRYDVEGISSELFEQCIDTVFSEPQSDVSMRELPELTDEAVFAVEYLPGQFDQRADSASECIQLISCGERPLVRSATVYVLSGELSAQDVDAVKSYVINPVEALEASLDLPDTLAMEYVVPDKVEILDGFCEMTSEELSAFIDARGLAMDLADITFCQEYFTEEKRDPTITEIKMIDTYWSDHCRHTTFNTELEDIAIEDEQVCAAFVRYLELRKELGREEKPVCLMDMGTIGAKYLKAKGILKNLDESDEINACTVKVKCDVDGEEQDWLYLFKNETHNHPTEIEPFGGAATCVGGAIRDPLSGRSYVYQAMRVTGAADPLVPVDQTIPGKLPQRKLVMTAAAGYSSYGNQIGLATGQVNELYHPGYAAKRMEIGAVVGATPASHVRREEPAPGDVVVLLGGRTGRDGIGGATGSSKAHKKTSLATCGAEVQKGNPPVERKLQRLFRREDACKLIKRCNDFGAGGVSVAIGELANGLSIELDRVPKKYEGLDGTELAISESQERMAVALAAQDVDAFIAMAHEENLEATPVAVVTDDERVRMQWAGDTIVDVSRAFLGSNGAPKHMTVKVGEQGTYERSWEGDTLTERLEAVLSDLNVCSNKGLSERFDSTIGAATVLMPFGGKRQLTPSMAMVAKLPVDGETTTCSGMAWGFNPYLSSANQYQGAYLAVVESVAKLVAAGFDHHEAYLTFQEYFEKLGADPARWGKPTAALLGSLMAQVDLGVGSIGGKDSMSGSFEDLDVPPTLVSFATAVGSIHRVMSPEFKCAGSRIVALKPVYDGLIPRKDGLLDAISVVEELTAAAGEAEEAGKDAPVRAIATIGYGCAAETLFKMCVGNGLGIAFDETFDPERLFCPAYGSFIVELPEDALSVTGTANMQVIELGSVTEAYQWSIAGEAIELAALQEAWESKLEPVFPYRGSGDEVKQQTYDSQPPLVFSENFAKPRVIIPVFPGTNCEYDTARAFRRAGALPTTLVINNLSPEAVAESTQALADAIKQSQIIMIPGGFSGGDEPDGSAKLITAFFRSPWVTDAVRDLLHEREGLMLGICNGFQALVKLGLVPFGDVVDMEPNYPTLTFNSIGRHQSRLVRTRIASSVSPWLSLCNVGDIHTVAISHGEGRFTAPEGLLRQLSYAGQIATQYVDEYGQPSMDLDVNPNGSDWAIEGITSLDGRVLGKMGHSERAADGLYKNVAGNTFQPIFEGGVAYFA
ncbi:MAG: phosphoribosylformylglycinamidine synthase [Eggerthellaceae bacterium]|nr:phosphoribosylformylglycinamidine synthase [Eggerthellaceae bacterium]